MGGSSIEGSEGVEEVPGRYGLPIIGATVDRFSYFVSEGIDAFFKKRIDKYKSTVFRVNMPPGPPWFRVNPRVIMLLDAKSFPILFDVNKVEKKGVLTGVYMPSTNFTGGYRMLPYLDPSEERHTNLKNFCFHLLKTNAKRWFPEFERAVGELFAKLDEQFAESDRAEFSSENMQMCFNFLCRTMLNRDPAEPGPGCLEREGPGHVVKWLGFQLAPIASTGVIPKMLEEVTIHTLPLPFLLVRGSYNKLYDFCWRYGRDALDHAVEQLGLEREAACHNLLFNICFNAFGGMVIFFPSLVRRIAGAGREVQGDLAGEVRGAIDENRGLLNMRALERMALVKSTVYEALRIDPPVPFQYGHAKEDLVVESHDGKYAVKKGDMLGGYQPFVTRDPKVFEDPEEFLPRRLMGEGVKLLKYVLWSNGRETEETTAHNKQCAGKNFVVMISRLLVAHLFSHYHHLEVDPSATGNVVFTSLH